MTRAMWCAKRMICEVGQGSKNENVAQPNPMLLVLPYEHVLSFVLLQIMRDLITILNEFVIYGGDARRTFSTSKSFPLYLFNIRP